MKYLKLIAFFFLFLAMLFASCKKNDGGEEPDSKSANSYFFYVPGTDDNTDMNLQATILDEDDGSQLSLFGGFYYNGFPTPADALYLRAGENTRNLF